MSAAVDLQLTIAQKLAASVTATLGDGVASEFPITHNFDSQFLYLTLRQGETDLVNGTDYTVALSERNIATITALNGAPALDAWQASLRPLRVRTSPMGADYVLGTVPIVARMTKEKSNDVEAAMAQKTGLCLFVMPMLPRGVARGVPFLFFERAEVRIRIIEMPAMNGTGVDAYDLAEDVMGAIHWCWPAGQAHPIEARDPEIVEGIGVSEDKVLHGQLTRIIDCVFEAHFGQQPGTEGTL
jgi:hypothetical protein